MTITERIFVELSQKDINQKDFAAQINVNEKTVSAWKKNNSLPPADKLSKISDFLEISLEYLITGKEKSPSSDLTEKEHKLINLYKNLNEFEQGEVIGYIKRILEERPAGEKGA